MRAKIRNQISLVCAAYNGSPALVHRHRGHKVFFHVGVQDRKLVAIPGIHYFDAHRLQPDLLDTLDRQIDPWSIKLASPEGAEDTCPTQRKPFLHTRKPWSSPTVMATGKIDVVVDCHPRKVCAHLAECGL